MRRGSPAKHKADTGNVVAVDLGEIHPIVSFDGLTSEIYNGRVFTESRSIPREIQGENPSFAFAM